MTDTSSAEPSHGSIPTPPLADYLVGDGTMILVARHVPVGRLRAHSRTEFKIIPPGATATPADWAEGALLRCCDIKLQLIQTHVVPAGIMVLFRRGSNRRTILAGGRVTDEEIAIGKVRELDLKEAEIFQKSGGRPVRS